MCNEREEPEAASEDRVTDYDVMKAIAVGCRQGHPESIAAARRVITELAAAPPETLSEVFDGLLDAGMFTDEDIESPGHTVIAAPQSAAARTITAGDYEAPDGSRIQVDLDKLTLPCVVPLMKDGIQIGMADIDAEGGAVLTFELPEDGDEWPREMNREPDQPRPALVAPELTDRRELLAE